MTALEKTLYDLCLPLTDDNANLSVKQMSSADENEILLYVYASGDDVARLIGRKGVMATALRQMMSIAARNEKKRVSVKLEAY